MPTFDYGYAFLLLAIIILLSAFGVLMVYFCSSMQTSDETTYGCIEDGYVLISPAHDASTIYSYSCDDNKPNNRSRIPEKPTRARDKTGSDIEMEDFEEGLLAKDK